MSKQITGQSSKQGKPGQNKQTGSEANKQAKTETSPLAKTDSSKQTKSEPNKSGKVEPNKQTKSNKSGKVGPSKPTVRQMPKQVRQDRRREEQRRREEEQRRTARTRRIALFSALAILLVVGVSVFFYVRAAKQASQPVNPAYPTAGKISCDQGEQGGYHIHARVTMYINGPAVQLPQGVGVATDNSCLYWLHTHDTKGVIHIEAPGNSSIILGNFVDLWGNQFASLSYPPELDQNYGWQAWVNGKPYTGDFRKIPLNKYTLVTLAYNSPGVKPDTTYDWSGL